MQRFIIFSICAVVLFSATASPLRAEPLAAREGLSLFGYQLGMSIDAARARHPFHEVHTSPRYSAHNSSLVAVVADLGQAVRPRRCSLGFKNNRLVKVVASYDLSDLVSIKWALEETLGTGEEEFQTSRTMPAPIDSTALVWRSMVDQILLITVPQNFATFTLLLQERQ